ncbi:MAG: hypothetical protein AAF639_23810 [Chloroflexota bacterium]
MNTFIRMMIACSLVVSFMLIASPSPAMAQLQPGYSSGIQVANLEAEEATITITAYDTGGGIAATINDTVPANGSVTYVGASMPVNEGFSGAFVISSNKQTAALSNILSANGELGAAYVGSDVGGVSILLPLLQKQVFGYSTWYSVQNAGSSVANVTANYSTGEQVQVQVPVGAAHVFYQDQEGHAANSTFSAEITSDQPIVAAVIQEDSSTMFSYTGFNRATDTSTNPAFPLINSNNFGFVTGVQIQNASETNTDTTVTLSYTPSLGGTACTETQTIPAGQSSTFTLGAFNVNGNAGIDTTCIAGETFIGAAKVTANSADQPLVGMGSQLLPGTFGEAYGSFSPSKATNQVVMPLIMDRVFGYNTGFNIVHVGGPASTVNCTYSNSSVTESAELAVDGAFTAQQRDRIADTYVGSATCTAGAGTQIIAVVNELRVGSPATDQFLVYEGVSVGQ